MATVACPGCGLPRAESELETTPCPLCAQAKVPAKAQRAKPTLAPDPTAGLPSDVSELDSPGTPHEPPRRSTGSASRLRFAAVVFVLGALCGIGGIIGYQALERTQALPDGPELAAGSTDSTPGAPGASESRGPALAPMPHEPGAQVLAKVATTPEPPEPEPKPLQPLQPQPPQPPPPPGRVTVIDLGPDPPPLFTIPFAMKKGEHVVLKAQGKLKVLRVNGLDAGAVLDASGVDAATVQVGGRIDNGSTLKLKATNGQVTFGAKVDHKSIVEIDAPGGDVKFTGTPGAPEVTKIDNGAAVTITARVVEFKGDIGGADTKVSIVLTRSAWLKVASVSGRATVEYKSQMAAWSPPDVIVGSVAPGATFRKIE
jgi:hypothetical protein